MAQVAHVTNVTNQGCMNGDAWIGAEEAGRILHVSARMVYRYGQGEAPKLRTMRAGRRILFSHADVLAYADELGAENKPPTQTDIVRADELMRVIGSLQAELVHQAEELGELRSRLSREEEQALRDRLHDMERERDRLRWENERMQADQNSAQPVPAASPRPWWKRIFGA